MDDYDEDLFDESQFADINADLDVDDARYPDRASDETSRHPERAPVTAAELRRWLADMDDDMAIEFIVEEQLRRTYSTTGVLRPRNRRDRRLRNHCHHRLL